MGKKYTKKQLKKLCDGKYVKWNMVTVCALCHRKIHAGIIKILGQHPSTKGRHIIHYLENEQEMWK